ncbi:MAG: SIS domain-containing protein, partial [Thermoplasmata archaeon]|nr:SIS domain-containing protein [Thermoplasmata archaeon]
MFLIDSILGTNKVFIYGVGRSGTMSKAFAIRLVQLGLKVFFVGETITPIVEKDDLVIIVSNTGETMSAIQTA